MAPPPGAAFCHRCRGRGILAGRHCTNCGAALTGSRFCINCGSIADDSLTGPNDGDTLSDTHVPIGHGTNWTPRIVVAVVALGLVAVGFFLLRPGPADGDARNPTPQGQASPDTEGLAVPDASGGAETQASEPWNQSTPVPSGTPTGPQSLPTPRAISVLRPSGVSATCEGTPGFDSRKAPVLLNAAQLIDGQSDTTWRCTYREDSNDQRWDPAKNRAVGESVTFYFPRPYEVQGARLIPGYTKVDPYDGANRYAANGRPVLVEWQFGDGPAVRQSLNPKPASSEPRCSVAQGACSIGEDWWSDEALNPIPATAVSTVTLTILAIEAGNDLQLANSAAISEVEVLGYS